MLKGIRARTVKSLHVLANCHNWHEWTEKLCMGVDKHHLAPVQAQIGSTEKRNRKNMKEPEELQKAIHRKTGQALTNPNEASSRENSVAEPCSTILCHWLPRFFHGFPLFSVHPQTTGTSPSLMMYWPRSKVSAFKKLTSLRQRNVQSRSSHKVWQEML